MAEAAKPYALDRGNPSMERHEELDGRACVDRPFDDKVSACGTDIPGFADEVDRIFAQPNHVNRERKLEPLGLSTFCKFGGGHAVTRSRLLEIV
jgi:hypothetical protein